MPYTMRSSASSYAAAASSRLRDNLGPRLSEPLPERDRPLRLVREPVIAFGNFNEDALCLSVVHVVGNGARLLSACAPVGRILQTGIHPPTPKKGRRVATFQGATTTRNQ